MRVATSVTKKSLKNRLNCKLQGRIMMKNRLTIMFALVFALFLVACGGTAPEPAPEPEPIEEVEEVEEVMEEEVVPSIAEIAVGDGNFTTLVAALDAAGLVETLSGEGAFTVFAPTDAAFAALPEGTVEALLEDPEGALTAVLLYHVIDGVVMAETVVTLDIATTLQGEDVSINAEDGVVLNGSVNVVTTDIEASNGVIHVIDAVLLPPSMTADEEMTEEEAMMEEPTMSIAEIAVADGSFTTLVAALDAAGLVETLSGEGAFTVFAPTDAAFAALPEGTVEALLEDPEGALTDILLYHVVDGVVKAETVVTLESATTLNGADVSINAEDGVVLNGSVNVVMTDIMATNGVIHVIDAVLLPPAEDAMEEEAMMEEPTMSIAEIAVADGSFTTLVAALDAAGLVETLSGEGAFTVFAPTDAAFAALPEGTVEALLEDPEGALTDILLYHVAAGIVTSDVVVTLESATTLNGADVTISIDDDGNVVLNDLAKVVLVDVKASNGVIHVIDMVLLPPASE
jgi:transforming growth factor-beta-induced protein